MSRVLSATEIAALALGMTGHFPVTDTAADPAHLRRALQWLDLILAEAVGTERMFRRLQPQTLSMAIENGTQAYDLYTELGEALPDDGIQYVVDAYLQDEDGNRTPVEIVTVEKFEDVPKLAEEGAPTRIHIDRQANGPDNGPTLRIFPTPDAADTTDYTLKLVCQRFAPNVAPNGVTGAQPNTVAHEFGVAWQRWMVATLAHDIGSGPMGKLPEASLNRFAAMASAAKAKLLAFENREHETTPPICEPWGAQ